MTISRFTVTAADAPEWVREREENAPAIFCSHCGLETDLVPVFAFGHERPTREITKCCGAKGCSGAPAMTPYR